MDFFGDKGGGSSTISMDNDVLDWFWENRNWKATGSDQNPSNLEFLPPFFGGLPGFQNSHPIL